MDLVWICSKSDRHKMILTECSQLNERFFRLLALLIELKVHSSSSPCTFRLILQCIWDANEFYPQSTLDFFMMQTQRLAVSKAEKLMVL